MNVVGVTSYLDHMAFEVIADTSEIAVEFLFY
jgi:hypothetical protein